MGVTVNDGDEKPVSKPKAKAEADDDAEVLEPAPVPDVVPEATRRALMRQWPLSSWERR